MTTPEDKIAAVIALRAEMAGLASAQPALSKLSAEDLAEVKGALYAEAAGICDAALLVTQAPERNAGRAA